MAPPPLVCLTPSPLKLRVFDKDGNHLAISRVDFGSKFHSESIRCGHEHRNSSNFNFSIQLQNVQDRCQKFLLQLIEQIEQRLPSNKDIFAGLSILKPSKVLSHVHRAIFEQLPFRKFLPEQGIDEIEEQHRKILLQPWNEEEIFKSGLPNNPVQFWAAILRFQDTTGSCPYKDLATYALACFSTPVSNALVERVFSHVNAVKTD